MIVILGPTASGKTQLAVKLASQINGEIISADSRQVYRGMDVGTGKDIEEYGEGVSYHLIDILNAGEKYNLADFQKDFKNAVYLINADGKVPILCGGTGLYIQAVIQDFTNTNIPENFPLRKQLEDLTNAELEQSLINAGLKFDTRKRAIRLLEIEEFKSRNKDVIQQTQQVKEDFQVFGLNPPLEIRRHRISARLKDRIQREGLFQEVQDLIYSGVTHEMLEYYGLEYKYISLFLQGFLRYDEMYTKLETEIHRYAKRQMTFFRSMEKKGIEIDWIDDKLTLMEKVDYMKTKTMH